MNKYTNNKNISLPMAIFLATDNYDHDPNTLSATALIKPVRQLVLSERVSPEDSVTDISNLVKSRLGTAIHDGAENAIKTNYAQALTDLGLPKEVIERIRINPTDEALAADPEIIPFYLEQRLVKEFEGFTITGKVDVIIEDKLRDYKTTSAFAYVHDVKNQSNTLQGSIYRWLDNNKIKNDAVEIIYIIMDYSAAQSYSDGYPADQVVSKDYQLLPLNETEAYIRNKLADYVKYKDADEADIPECEDHDLWRRDPVWKYYKNPDNRKRSTKNFTEPNGAYKRLADDGNVGVVVEVKGEVVACKYCPAFLECSQKDRLIADGSLKL